MQVSYQRADFPWPDLIRKKVGRPSNTDRATIKTKLTVKLLIPRSEEANAKIILTTIMFYSLLINTERCKPIFKRWNEIRWKPSH